ncbi:MAG: NAD-dependent epimerase/dehydratase family protein, partial [Thermoleophilia bacterium]|nr:NAD-dependent epimerase/dehydratase family protein [Thermoleophilia bacterium]
LRDEGAVDRALDGVDTVFHLGGIVGNGQSMVELRLYADVNVVGTATLLEAIARRRADVKKLVVASSMVVYGDGAYGCAVHGEITRAPPREPARLARGAFEPTCPRCGADLAPLPTREDHPLAPTSGYGVCKRDQEELSLIVGRAYGVPTIALRFLNTYGSRQALANPYTGVCAIMAMRFLLGKAPTIFEDGGQLRDPIHVSDVVAATMAAGSAGPAADYQAINVGAGRPTSVLGMAEALARAIGADIVPDVTGEFRRGDIRHCFADTSRAREILGFEARVSFEEGARELAAWAAHEAPEDRTEAANAELRRAGLIG